MTETTHEALLRQTAKADELLGYFQGHRDSLEADRLSHGQAIDAFVSGAARHHPLVRLSKSQYGNLDVANGVLEGWVKNGGGVNIEIAQTIASGTPFGDRPADEQEILTAMGHPTQHFFPNSIHVMRMTWANMAANSWTTYPTSIPFGGRYLTTASYAKLISGNISGYWLEGVSNQWKLCGQEAFASPGGYMHAHPITGSADGEVLFIWAAVAAGRAGLDPNAPSWGYLPHISADNPTDVSV